MRASALKYLILTWVGGFVLVIFLLMPFHAFLTVWLSSWLGHYTALRLWVEVLLVLSVLGVLFLLATDHKIRSHTLPRRLTQLILLYVLINLIWGAVAWHHHAVTAKALGYGLIVNLRFPIFFLVCWSVSLRTKRIHNPWRVALIVPSIIVVTIGLLQMFVLPYDFLKHFGYSTSTIFPYETINHNVHYIRVMSTLRGANPLGAYLLLPISYLTVLIARGHRQWQNVLLWVASLLTLYFSFSRSAWIGAVVAMALIVWLSLRSAKLRQQALLVAAAGLVIVAGIGFGLRHHPALQNIVQHTQSHSAVKQTSNAGHWQALKTGIHDIVHEPLGRGPGTAGPASLYNDKHHARIAENYFIQVGQETGWIGLLVFMLINAGVGYLLWCRRADPLALALFVSLIGLSLVNCLSHAWTDDTLSYVWWGLAGIAMVSTEPTGAAKPAKTKKT
ncbi:MAG TPA: O-antigen ligase family protein [Candidatus Saccharimonadales bacterium]|nr:O-antigen ligase family protein [Candidatus Saccharimonadales bacterium]